MNGFICLGNDAQIALRDQSRNTRVGLSGCEKSEGGP